jgi:hypothetical protein
MLRERSRSRLGRRDVYTKVIRFVFAGCLKGDERSPGAQERFDEARRGALPAPVKSDDVAPQGLEVAQLYEVPHFFDRVGKVAGDLRLDDPERTKPVVEVEHCLCMFRIAGERGNALKDELGKAKLVRAEAQVDIVRLVAPNSG